jgi:hypothetical protein
MPILKSRFVHKQGVIMQIHKGFTLMIALVVMIVVGIFYLNSTERMSGRGDRLTLLSVHNQAKILLENSIANGVRMAKEDNSTIKMGDGVVMNVSSHQTPTFTIETHWSYVWCTSQGCTPNYQGGDENSTRGIILESEVKSLQFPVRVYKKTIAVW